MLPLLFAGLLAAGGTDTSSAAPALQPHVLVGPTLRDLAMPVGEEALAAVRERRWADAARALEAVDPGELAGPQRGAHAFVLAWALVHDGRAEEAAPYLVLASGAPDVPESYLALLRGEVARAADDGLTALAELETVGEHAVVWPRAMVQRAEVLRELGRTNEGFALYEHLITREDPAAGNPEALLALAQREGEGSPGAYAHLRRVWVHYPRTDHAVEAARRLAAYPAREPYLATWQEVGTRAEHLMRRGEYGAALAETGARLSEMSGDNEDTCRILFTRGRSYYKLNQLSNAVKAFGDAGKRCVGVEGAYGPRSLYLQATASFRRGEYRTAARINQSLADLYPEHSMADDGLTRGGIALQEAEEASQKFDKVKKKRGNLLRFPSR